MYNGADSLNRASYGFFKGFFSPYLQEGRKGGRVVHGSRIKIANSRFTGMIKTDFSRITHNSAFDFHGSREINYFFHDSRQLKNRRSRFPENPLSDPPSKLLLDYQDETYTNLAKHAHRIEEILARTQPPVEQVASIESTQNDSRMDTLCNELKELKLLFHEHVNPELLNDVNVVSSKQSTPRLSTPRKCFSCGSTNARQGTQTRSFLS